MNLAPTPSERPRVTLVVNPAAGRGHAGRAGSRAAAIIGPVARVEVLRPVDGAAGSIEAIRQAVARGTDAVVVCGGDGIVHLAANVLADGTVPLGVIPAGSGNDIADGMGMARDPESAARQVAELLVAGDVRRIDLGRCDGVPLVDGVDRAFVGLLYAGIDSAVNERANRMRLVPGPTRYNAALAIETARLRARRFRLEIDGEGRVIPAILVAIGNGPQYGGGKRMAPHARWDDGVLGMTVVGPVSRRTLARLAPTLPRAGHVGHPRVLLRDAKSVTLDCDDPSVVGYADGEPIGALPLRVWVSREALPVLAPAAATGTPG